MHESCRDGDLTVLMERRGGFVEKARFVEGSNFSRKEALGVAAHLHSGVEKRRMRRPHTMHYMRALRTNIRNISSECILLR
jgi:hypothetical protein